MSQSYLPSVLLTCLGIPEFTVSVVATAEELRAVVIKCDVPHSLFVPCVRAYTPPVIIHLPDLVITDSGYSVQQKKRNLMHRKSLGFCEINRISLSYSYGRKWLFFSHSVFNINKCFARLPAINPVNSGRNVFPHKFTHFENIKFMGHLPHAWKNHPVTCELKYFAT